MSRLLDLFLRRVAKKINPPSITASRPVFDPRQLMSALILKCFEWHGSPTFRQLRTVAVMLMRRATYARSGDLASLSVTYGVKLFDGGVSLRWAYPKGNKLSSKLGFWSKWITLRDTDNEAIPNMFLSDYMCVSW